MTRFHSPYFDLGVLRTMLDKRKRALDDAAATARVLPWSVYDGALAGEDARRPTDRGRGTYNHKAYGSMSFVYCLSCHKRGPLTSDSFLAVWYQCNACTLKNGDPPGYRRVAESSY